MGRALGIHYQFMHGMYGTVEMKEFSVFAPRKTIEAQTRTVLQVEYSDGGEEQGFSLSQLV